MVVGTPAAFALAWYVTKDPAHALAISAYALAGMLYGTYFADPDLDSEHITHTEARLRRIPIVGLPLYVVFVAFWYPYAKHVRHRGISHRPIVGTLLRLGYILLMFTLINTLVRWAIYGTPEGWDGLLLALGEWIVHNPAKAVAWVAGECLADLLHVLADALWPAAVHKTSVRWRVRNGY